MSDSAAHFASESSWFDLSAEEQQARIDQGFNEEIASDPSFAEKPFEEKLAALEQYEQQVKATAYYSPNSPQNIQIERNQRRMEREGLSFRNALHKVTNNHGSFLTGLQVAGDSLPGQQADASFGDDMAQLQFRQDMQGATLGQKKIATDFATWEKKTAEGSGWDDVKATLEFGKNLITNPGGIIATGLDSAASITAIGAGHAAGSAVGALAGPVGSKVGSKVGAVGGGILASLSPRMLQQMQEELVRRGQPATAENFQALAEDTSWFEPAQQEALTYSSALGAADVAMGGLLGRISTLPVRNARVAATNALPAGTRQALVQTAEAAGHSADDYIQSVIDGTARDMLAARPLKKKIAGKVGSYTGEALSEPASEAIALAAVGDEIKTEDLFYELIGGIGAAPYGAAVNTAIGGTKLTADLTKQGAKKVRADGSEEVRQAKALLGSDRKHGYRDEIEQATGEEDISSLIDPANKETYNPVKAMDILTKSSQEDAQQKAYQITKDFADSLKGQQARIIELSEKAANKKITKAEKKELESLQAAYEVGITTFKKLNAKNAQIQHTLTKQASEAPVEKVDAATAPAETVKENILRTLGSDHRSALTNADLDTLIAREDVDTETKDLAQSVKELSEARYLLEKHVQEKTMTQVHWDVFNGEPESGFKGINAYHRATAFHQQKGDAEGVQAQVDGLQTFARRHTQKAEVFGAIFKQAREGVPVSSEVQQAYQQYQKEALLRDPKKPLNIHKGSGNLVRTVELEAQALQKAVGTAQRIAGYAVPKTQLAPEPQKQPQKPSKAPAQAKVSVKEEKPSQSKAESVLKQLVDRGKATLKEGVYFIHPDAPGVRKNLAGSMPSGEIYVDLGNARKFWTDKDLTVSKGKERMFRQMRITAEEFHSLFGSQKEFNRFLVAHEISHQKNDDRKKYPVGSDGKIDTEHPDAIGIEQRATLDALTGQQKEKLEQIVSAKQSTEPSVENVNEVDFTDNNENTALGELEITIIDAQGNEYKQSFNTAMQQLNIELQEYETLRNCVAKNT